MTAAADCLATNLRDPHKRDIPCATEQISNLIIFFYITGLRFDGGVERPDFRRAERAPLTRGEPVVVQRAESGPDEAADGVADRLAHPADLAVAALVDHDLQRRAGRRRLGQAGPGRGGPAVVEVH